MIKPQELEILRQTMKANNLEERRQRAFLQQLEQGFFELK